MSRQIFLLVFSLVFGSISFAETEEAPSGKQSTVPEMMAKIRQRILPYKWDRSFFIDHDWKQQGHSVNGMPLIYWSCGNPKSENRALILSGVHGDEVTPIYFGFRVVEWLKANTSVCDQKFVVVAPIVNPDGFLRYTRGTRTNWNKVDLNRNFATPDWEKDAHQLWKSKMQSQRRYYPGDKAESEPETKFQRWLIENFKPAKIMSVHAPLNLLDFDAPAGSADMEAFTKAYVESCDFLKENLKKVTTIIKFHAYGAFPGSLGNFAGRKLGIPTITPELPTSNASEAAFYFGEMEQSTRLFLEYKMPPRPINSVANKN